MTSETPLPDQLEGHWDTAEGDLELIAFQEAAKQRIRWLSVQLALATRPPAPDKQLTDVVERLKNSLTCKGARLNDGDWTTLQARDVRAIIDAMDAISRCGISASDQAASA
jgi:hypothetical protein